MPKISALPPGTQLASADAFPFLSRLSNVTERVSFDTLQSSVANAGVVQSLIAQAAAAAVLGSSPATNINFTQTGPGAVTRPMQQKAQETVSVTDYMSPLQKADYLAGTLLVDCTSAYNTAFALTGRIVLLPAGNGLCASGLNPPVCSAIVGEGAIDTKITCAAGVAKGFSYTTASSNHLTRLSGFSIWGNATAAARGMVLGDGGITSDLAIYDVQVRNWTGVGAIGVDIQDADFYQIYNMVLIGNTQNLHIKGVTLTPTGIDFYSLVSLQATNEGVLIESGNNIRFYGPILETNGKEGIKVAPPVGGFNATEIIITDPRFEGNWTGNPANYHLVFDASAAAALIRATVIRGFWNTDGANAKSMKWTGACSGCGFFDPQVPNLSGQIFIDTNISSIRYSLPPNLIFSATAIVSDTAALAQNLYSLMGAAGQTYPRMPSGFAQSSVGMFAGSGLPSNAFGNNNDFYFRGEGGLGSTVFVKRLGSWTVA